MVKYPNLFLHRGLSEQYRFSNIYTEGAKVWHTHTAKAIHIRKHTNIMFIAKYGTVY